MPEFREGITPEAETKHTVTDKAVQERQVAGRIVEGLRKQKRSAAQIAALITSIGLAGCFHKDTTGQSIDIDKLKKIEEMDRLAEGPRPHYRNITPQERYDLTQEIGFDIVDMARDAGFDISLQVPTQSGKYILQIGQAHYVKDIENFPERAQNIIKIQKNIEQVLLALSEKGYRNVFAEAETDLFFTFNRHESIHQEAQNIPADKNCFSVLTQTCSTEIIPYLVKNNIQDDATALYIINVFKKRALECRKELESAGQFDDQVRESFEHMLSTLTPPASFSSFGEDITYLFGAENKLEYEGVVTLHPVEMNESNLGAHLLDPEIEKAKRAFLDADFSTLEPAEIEKLGNNYQQLVNVDNFFTMDAREDIALDFLRDYTTSTPQTEMLLPLIYGDDHDFENNVLKNNTQHPEHHFGLIRLTPRSHK